MRLRVPWGTPDFSSIKILSNSLLLFQFLYVHFSVCVCLCLFCMTLHSSCCVGSGDELRSAGLAVKYHHSLSHFTCCHSCSEAVSQSPSLNCSVDKGELNSECACLHLLCGDCRGASAFCAGDCRGATLLVFPSFSKPHFKVFVSVWSAILHDLVYKNWACVSNQG